MYRSTITRTMTHNGPHFRCVPCAPAVYQMAELLCLPEHPYDLDDLEAVVIRPAPEEGRMPKISACIVAYCDYDEVAPAVRSVLANTPAMTLPCMWWITPARMAAAPPGTDRFWRCSRAGDLPAQEPRLRQGPQQHYGPPDQRCTLYPDPDVIIHDDILPQMAQWLLDHPGVVMATPQLYFPDGRIQNLPRRKPTPWLLLAASWPRALAV